MYYEIHGQGEPLVLVLGLAADVSEYGWLIQWLAKKRKVLVFDNRGAGRTDKPDTPYSIEMMANDTAELMRAVDFGRADVAGISMGGRIALELALGHLEAVRNLVLVSTSARIIRTWRRYVILGVLPRLPLFKGKHPQPYYAFSRQREASSGYDCTSRLPEINVPAFIMNGAKDKSAPRELAEELHAGIKGSKLFMFKGGHMFFMLRERQQFLDTMAACLEA